MQTTDPRSATPGGAMPRGIKAGAPLPPAADGRTVAHLPLDRVRPHAFNPRKTFDQDYLEELAESIREKGVLQPITVRPITHGLVFGEDVADHYAIVMGECRYRASRLAGMATIRAIVEEMDDREHLERAIVENIQRRQLNPIDEARGYQALRGMGMSVTEIAAKVGRGQPAVSKSLSLLSLPEKVVESVAGGELSVSQGLVIKRYDAHPAVVEALATAVVRDKIASHTLEKGLPRSVTAELKKSRKASDFSYDDRFRQEICVKSCPFGAYAKDDWGNPICLKPEHLKELRAEQKRVQAEKDEKTLACAQAAGVTARLSDMGRESYSVVGPASRPSACTESCACRGKAVSQWNETVTICTNPERYKRLQDEDRKRREAAEAEKAKAVRERLSVVLAELDAAPETFDRETRREELQRRSAVLALKELFHGAEVADVRRAAEALGMALDYGDYNVYNLKYGAFLGSLARYGVTAQIRLVTEMITRRQIEREHKGHGSTGALDWFLSDVRIPSVWELATAEAEPAQTPAPESTPPAGQVIGGVLIRTEISEDGDEARCARCNQWAGIPDLHNRMIWRLQGGDGPKVLHSPFGAVITPQGMVYCTDCGPSVLYCRECGCTNEAGCDLGGGETCCWTEPDLCSACATKGETFDDGESMEVGA